MITHLCTIRADRLSGRKAGHPDQPAAQNFSGAITGDSIMKHIPLTKGKFAIVDDADYKWLNQWKWYARKCQNRYYAARKITVNGKQHTVYMHRFIMNVLPELEVDHKNRNSLDDRRNNLRICQSQQNKWNTNLQKRKKTSKYKGVCFDKQLNKWKAYISLNDEKIHLGYYKNEDEAGLAYNSKAIEFFGEFANLNKIQPLFPVETKK